MDSADGCFEKQLLFKWFSSSDGKDMMKLSQQSEQVGSHIYNHARGFVTAALIQLDGKKKNLIWLMTTCLSSALRLTCFISSVSISEVNTEETSQKLGKLWFPQLQNLWGKTLHARNCKKKLKITNILFNTTATTYPSNSFDLMETQSPLVLMGP